MNPHHDLEGKLRAIYGPATADPAAKERLHAILRARVQRGRERRGFLRGAILTAMVMSILIASRPAVTRYDVFRIWKTENADTVFRTDGDPNLAISVNDLEAYERLSFMLKQEESSLMHMAGETQLTKVSGYSFGGRTMLLAQYRALTSLGPHKFSNVVRDDFLPEAPAAQDRFLEETYARCLQMVFSGQVPASGDSTLVTMNHEVELKRYVIPTAEFGEVTIWWGTPDSTDG